jgi:phage terminase large subunit-like protein
MREMGSKILRGQLEDDRFFSIIFTMDEKDNLENTKLWIKSNPNLGVTVQLADLVKDFTTAKNLGGTNYNSFLTKNLNLWTDAAAVWIHDEVWMKNHHKFSIKDLVGKPCYGGLDCAKSIDLNAWVLYFPDVFEVNDKPISAFLPFFWIPEEYIKKNRDRIDYSRWVEQGYIIKTSGNIADWKQIEFDILNSIKPYDFQGLSYDPAYAGNVAANLADEGLRCSPLRQGFISLTNPTNELARLATGGLLEHFNNPVMRWMMGNVEISKDAAGNIKPDKAKSSNKIDGVAALVDAIADARNESMKENKSSGMFIV